MRITRDNLDETIALNVSIEKEIEDHIRYIEKILIKWRSLPIEEQAFEILKEYRLIEIPIPDENWGGAIRKFNNGKMVPIINTAQPRLYQYFIYWHEIYHLTESNEKSRHREDYEISTEFDLNERRADYFSSQMIFGHYDLYDYFQAQKSSDFLVKIAHCMKSFKAPYKAVLIQLYQIAKKNNNESLQEQIKLYFDKRLSTSEWSRIFQENMLDDSLLKPSLITNLNSVKQAIQQEIIQHPDVELYQDNINLLQQWEQRYKKVQKELKGQLNDEL